MKYFVNFVVLIFVVFLCNSSAKSNEKFAYIDIDKIMRQSKAGKSINKQLESLLSKTTKKAMKINNKLESCIAVFKSYMPNQVLKIPVVKV